MKKILSILLLLSATAFADSITLTNNHGMTGNAFGYTLSGSDYLLTTGFLVEGNPLIAALYDGGTVSVNQGGLIFSGSFVGDVTIQRLGDSNVFSLTGTADGLLNGVFTDGVFVDVTIFNVRNFPPGSSDLTNVPEPSTLVLFGSGLALIAFSIRRQGA